MCKECWNEWGAPRIDTPAVRAAAMAIAAVYAEPHGCTGGGMHVQLDDWNIEDVFFDDEARRMIETYGDPDERSVQYGCFDLMRALTESERASALGLEAEYWGAQEIPFP